MEFLLLELNCCTLFTRERETVSVNYLYLYTVFAEKYKVAFSSDAVLFIKFMGKKLKTSFCVCAVSIYKVSTSIKKVIHFRSCLHNTISTKNETLCMRFGHSFTQQQRFGGLKMQTFENRFQSLSF